MYLPMFALGAGGQQVLAQEFAQFGICLDQIAGVFTDLPGNDDLGFECLNYLPDASGPRVWGVSA